MLAHASRGPLDLVFSALSDPSRRRMLDRLARGPATVSELAQPFDMTLAAVAQHVQVLEKAHLVATSKVGRARVCRLDVVVLREAERWIAERRGLWERRLDLLGEVLADPTGLPPPTTEEQR